MNSHPHILISLSLSRSLSTFVQRKKLTCIHTPLIPHSHILYLHPHTHPSPVPIPPPHHPPQNIYIRIIIHTHIFYNKLPFAMTFVGSKRSFTAFIIVIPVSDIVSRIHFLRCLPTPW